MGSPRHIPWLPSTLLKAVGISEVLQTELKPYQDEKPEVRTLIQISQIDEQKETHATVHSNIRLLSL